MFCPQARLATREDQPQAALIPHLIPIGGGGPSNAARVRVVMSDDAQTPCPRFALYRELACGIDREGGGGIGGGIRNGHCLDDRSPRAIAEQKAAYFQGVRSVRFVGQAGEQRP